MLPFERKCGKWYAGCYIANYAECKRNCIGFSQDLSILYIFHCSIDLFAFH